MDVVEALRTFARRWALLQRLDQEALLKDGRLPERESRVRDQLCFVLRGLTHASDELLGLALDMSATKAMRCRHRYWQRHKAQPSIEAMTALQVTALSQRDPDFITWLADAVAAEMERRAAITNRARADTLFRTSQHPAFEIGRRAALDAYFDGGGRQALADRSRGNRWGAKDPS